MAENRKKLYGKDATDQDFIDEIVRLRFGDHRTKQEPLTYTAIATRIGLSRQWVYEFRKKAIEQGRIAVDETTGKEKRSNISDIVKNLKIYNSFQDDNFSNDPLVRPWIEDMLTRKQGNPIKTWRDQHNGLKSLCVTLKINPQQLLVDHDTTEKILKNFAELYKQGKVEQGGGRKANLDSIGGIHSRVMAVRDFCGFHHMTWRRGVGGIMSGKVIGHGKYADIRLTKEELDKANQFILDTWGLDSDIYRIFWVGVESCARMRALLRMKCQWSEHTNEKTGKKTFFMTATETKTAHIKEGKWTKYITRLETQESLSLHRQNGQQFLWTNGVAESTKEIQMSKQLKEIYKAVGKLDEYYYQKPFHSMRHIGAHYWLEKRDYNYGLVAILGGWHTQDELKKSYGEMPPEKVLEVIEREDEKN